MIAALPPKAEKARRLHPSGQQSRAPKPETDGRQSIRVSARHKEILADVRSTALASLDLVDQMLDNNLPGGDAKHFAENAGLLALSIRRCKRLCRSVQAVNRHAQKEAAR